MEDHLEGYRHLTRAEELWLLARRKQSFTNWYTKLLLVYIYMYTYIGHAGAVLLSCYVCIAISGRVEMACKWLKPGLWMWRSTASENILTKVTDHRFCRTGYESALTDAPSPRLCLLPLVLDIVCALVIFVCQVTLFLCSGCTCSSNAGPEALHAAELLARSTRHAAELPPG